jgi:hypothetical protein
LHYRRLHKANVSVVQQPLVISLDGRRPQLPLPVERRRRRERASLRLADLAHILRVDISTVSRWERGIVEPHGSGRLVYAALLAGLNEAPKRDTPPAATDGASKLNALDVHGAGYRRRRRPGS